MRDDLFCHMERLPVRYFDTKSHGDIMSIYTNDTDTLRQVISQSMPQMLSAVITIAGVFASMLVLSLPLTLITVVMILCMVFATRTISSKSGHYFVKQQTDVGNLNGYIEKMMEGQKVVKVFCHETASIKDFKDLNGKLRDSANNANRYTSILMPVLILDEATSSIDTRTEKIVQDGMDRLMKGRTVFVIAHRLSTIRNSDVIMVLDHGRIVERGNHESLLAKKGMYYQLYTNLGH